MIQTPRFFFLWGVRGAPDAPLTPTDISDQATETAEVSLGGTFACRLRTDASVNCWGSNNYGQLGDGTTDTGYGPNTNTTLTNVAQLVAGYWHACARKHDGTLWCWGQYDRGQVGDGTRDDALVPTQVQGLTGAALRVATSDERTCALLEGGSVWCWGRASWSDTQGDPMPRLVDPLDEGVRSIAAGMWHLLRCEN